jgi:hypothetical protein
MGFRSFMLGVILWIGSEGNVNRGYLGGDLAVREL